MKEANNVTQRSENVLGQVKNLTIITNTLYLLFLLLLLFFCQFFLLLIIIMEGEVNASQSEKGLGVSVK